MKIMVEHFRTITGYRYLSGVSGLSDGSDSGLAEVAVSPTSKKDITDLLDARGVNYTTALSDLAL